MKDFLRKSLLSDFSTILNICFVSIEPHRTKLNIFTDSVVNSNQRHYKWFSSRNFRTIETRPPIQHVILISVSSSRTCSQKVLNFRFKFLVAINLLFIINLSVAEKGQTFIISSVAFLRSSKKITLITRHKFYIHKCT